MVPPLVSTRRNNIKMTESESGEEPLAGMVTSVILAMVSLVIISSFLSTWCTCLVNSVSGCCGMKLTYDSPSKTAQRFLAVKVWSRLPPVQWSKSCLSLAVARKVAGIVKSPAHN